MGSEYTALFQLAHKHMRATALRTFLANMKLVFLASCWRSQLTPGNTLTSTFSTELEESEYFRRCWEEGEALDAQFSGDDFHFDLRVFDRGAHRCALLRISELNLGGLAGHLYDEGIGFFMFYSTLETSLSTTSSVLGADASLQVLIDFLDGHLGPEETSEYIRIASNPNNRSLQILQSLGFSVRTVGDRRLFAVQLPVVDFWEGDDG
jgi:hypothetical protein